MSELSDAINEMRNMRESYNQIGAAAEAYNTGKPELAAAIRSKGVEASASETLPELAEKVGIIAQTQTILEGGEVMAAQQFGDGALWNLYQVLADMKTRFIGSGDYSALIVCEYYKGYDSLQLQGADAYYTCDGDLYEYASPTHVWHDSDNGKMNRWVAFLYRDEGARLDITNTAISPRSMYIGGHIGTIEYFVNGRLTDFVCGVEETDVLDNFLVKGFTQEWLFNLTFKNVRNIKLLTTSSQGAFVWNTGSRVDMDLTGLNLGYNGVITANSASSVKVTGVRSVGTLRGNAYFISIGRNATIVESDIEEVYTSAVAGGAQYIIGVMENASHQLQRIDLRHLIKCGGNSDDGLFGDMVSRSPDLIDVWVGAMGTRIRAHYWNPTNVLTDPDKKAQLIENIKNHILARVSDRTGLSQLVFTISSNMYNNISSEQIEWQGETMSLADAFLTKNWLLAGA